LQYAVGAWGGVGKTSLQRLNVPYFTDHKAQFKFFYFLINWSCAL